MILLFYIVFLSVLPFQVFAERIPQPNRDFFSNTEEAKDNHAVYVQDVMRGSLAERLGFKQGDEILMINEHKINSTEMVPLIIRRALISKQNLSFLIRRGGKILVLKTEAPIEPVTKLGLTLSSRQSKELQSTTEEVRSSHAVNEHILEEYSNEREKFTRDLYLKKREVEAFKGDLNGYLQKGWDMLFQSESREEVQLVVMLWEKAKQFYPKSDELSYNLALLYDYLDDYEGAVREGSKVVGPDRNSLKELINKNKQRLQQIDEAWRKLVEGEFTLVKNPHKKLVSYLQDIRFIKKEGKIFINNPVISYWNSHSSQHSKELQLSLRKNLEQDRYIPVDRRGKFFEVRWLELMITAGPPYSFVYCYNLLEGEIIIGNPKPRVILRHYRFDNVGDSSFANLRELEARWDREMQKGNARLNEIIFKRDISQFRDEVSLIIN